MADAPLAVLADDLTLGYGDDDVAVSGVSFSIPVGGILGIVGEAGSGKSRLIAEFLGRLGVDGRLDHMAVRRTVCSSQGEPTYGIFGALFREAYRVDPDDSLDIARQNDLRRQLGWRAFQSRRGSKAIGALAPEPFRALTEATVKSALGR